VSSTESPSARPVSRGSSLPVISRACWMARAAEPGARQMSMAASGDDQRVHVSYDDMPAPRSSSRQLPAHPRRDHPTGPSNRDGKPSNAAPHTSPGGGTPLPAVLWLRGKEAQLPRIC